MPHLTFTTVYATCSITGNTFKATVSPNTVHVKGTEAGEDAEPITRASCAAVAALVAHQKGHMLDIDGFGVTAPTGWLFCTIPEDTVHTSFDDAMLSMPFHCVQTLAIDTAQDDGHIVARIRDPLTALYITSKYTQKIDNDDRASYLCQGTLRVSTSVETAAELYAELVRHQGIYTMSPSFRNRAITRG